MNSKRQKVNSQKRDDSKKRFSNNRVKNMGLYKQTLISCPQASGIWDVSSVRPVEYNSEKDRLHIQLKGSNKIMIQTAAKEVLYLFVEPDKSIPTPNDRTVFLASYFGITPGDEEILTFKIQEGIEAVANNGGGTLVFPSGIYHTGTLNMKNNVFLYLCAGARIQGSVNKADYPVDPGKKGKGSEMIYTQTSPV